MVSVLNQVVWTKRSQHNIRQAYEYISKDSPKNARKVIEDIAEAAENIAIHPQRYPPDKFKLNNDGSYRAFTKHHFRVSYRVSNNIIRILGVRHTSRKPIFR
jgi:plasmid stabilization system protein ParE